MLLQEDTEGFKLAIAEEQKGNSSHCVGVCGSHVVKDETKGDSAFPDAIFLSRSLSHQASCQSSLSQTKKREKKKQTEE